MSTPIPRKAGPRGSVAVPKERRERSGPSTHVYVQRVALAPLVSTIRVTYYPISELDLKVRMKRLDKSRSAECQRQKCVSGEVDTRPR